jgi:Flp pilus assembly protein CpaB
MRSSFESLRFGGAGIYFAVAGLLALMAGVSVYSVLHAAVPSAQVFVVNRDLPPGTLVTDRDITTKQMPVGAMPAGVVTAKNGVVGHRVRFGMANGDVLRETHLVTQASSEIPQKVSAMGDDYRAVMVPSELVPAFERLIPGDRLEMLAILPIQEGPKGTNKLIALGIATVIDTPQNRGSADKGTVLVALRTADVARYALAARSGNLVVALQGAEAPTVMVPTLRLDELTGSVGALTTPASPQTLVAPPASKSVPATK